MIPKALPPTLWLPPKPAIIRPADANLKRANFLPAWFPAGAAAAAAFPTIEFLDEAQDATNATVYTFASFPLGTAAATRRIFVLVAWQGTGSLSSVTVAGVTASNHVQAVPGNVNIAIVSAAVPSGTSGSVVVTVSSTSGRCGIAAWRVTDLRDATPTGTDASQSVTSDTLTVNAPARSIVICGAINGAISPGDITISNV